MFLLLLVCAIIAGPAWSGRRGGDQEQAMHRAEILAYQVIEGQKSNSRAPASALENSLNHLTANEGEVGLDPWGHPYNFKVVKRNHQLPKVIVWSFGPDGVPQTNPINFESNRDNANLHFAGDDVGVMVLIK